MGRTTRRAHKDVQLSSIIGSVAAMIVGAVKYLAARSSVLIVWNRKTSHEITIVGVACREVPTAPGVIAGFANLLAILNSAHILVSSRR
jgi:hypothetical protein